MKHASELCAALNGPVDSFCRAEEAVLPMPVLLMYAENDSAFSPSMFQGTELNAPCLRLIKLESCSHWAQQDRHELVSQHLREFCSSGQTSTALAVKEEHV